MTQRRDRGGERLAEERAERDVLPGLDVARRPVVEADHAEDVVGERGDRHRLAQRGRGADDEAELGLDVEPARSGRTSGPRRRAPCAARAAGRRRCRDDDDGAGAAVVADREVPPVRQQRLAVGPEDPADVGGVVSRGVEVDVVGDLERQVQRHLGERHQVRLDVLAARRVAEQRGDPARVRRSTPRGPSAMSALSEGAAKTGARSSWSAAATGARSSTWSPIRTPTRGGVVPRARTRRTAGCRRRTPIRRRRRPRCVTSMRPPAVRCDAGRRAVRSTEQEPNEVNQRRAPARSSVAGEPDQRAPSSRCSRIATTSSREAPSKARRVATSTLRKPWCSKPVASSRCRTAWCSPAVHLNGVSRSSAASIQRGQRGGGRERRPPRAPPVRNFSRSSAAATSSAAASQPAVGLDVRQLDVDGHVVAERRPRRALRRPRPPPGGRCRRGRRGRAARSRGPRSARPSLRREPDRPGDLAGAAGDHHRQRARRARGPAAGRCRGRTNDADQVGVPLLAPGRWTPRSPRAAGRRRAGRSRRRRRGAARWVEADGGTSSRALL